MSETSFTTELINQGMKTERECQKLQALLHDKIPHSTFKWDKEKDDNGDSDDSDEPETNQNITSSSKEKMMIVIMTTMKIIIMLLTIKIITTRLSRVMMTMTKT
jgi:hypothetical protein